VLGVGMSIAPVGGYLAVTGQWPSPWWMPLVLSLAVTTWGAGFDILYALQDAELTGPTACIRSVGVGGGDPPVAHVA
jgi:4-hydroxybenzoate polyprenyltransferase